MGTAWFLIVAVITSVAFGCATASDAPVPGKVAPGPWEDVPMRWFGTYIFVEVGINGSPQALVLDTGADATVLAPDLASQLGVSTFKRDLRWETQRGRAASRPFTCASVNLRLGRLSQDADVLVHSLDGISRVFGEPVDGVLGLHMWAGVSLQIDYPRRAVRISEDALPSPDGKTVFPTSEGQARTRLELPGGKNVTVVIDSGSRACLVLPDALKREARFKVQPKTTGYVETFAGTVERCTGRLDGAVRIGRYIVKDPLVAFDSGDIGLVGTRLLENFMVTFDVTRSRVALDRAGPDVIEIPSLRGIGAGFVKDPGMWTVLYVLEGGPAERAGLRKGDYVVSINGAAENLRPDRLEQLVDTTDVVSVGVDRAGSLVRLDIPVEVLVE